MSFLGRSDLLKLALVDKRFNKIVTKSKETMQKIGLKLNFRELDIAEVISLANSRRFVVLKLSRINKSLAASSQFMSLMAALINSVEDLRIDHSDFEEHQLRWMMEIFLPKLLKCELFMVRIPHEANTSLGEAKLEHSHQRHQHSLKTLKLCYMDDDVTKFFTDCIQLKSLTLIGYGYHETRTDSLVTFLNRQTCLEKFDYDGENLAWDRLNCKQLKELNLGCNDNEDDILAASEFLKKHQNLEKLSVSSCKHRIIEAIVNLRKLGDLTIAINWGDDDANEFLGLKNSSVKRLRVEDWELRKYIGPLLKVFQGVQSIELQSEKVDLRLKKIGGIEGVEWILDSPTEEPSDVARFEEAVLNFVEKFPDHIDGITIGHENWLNNSNFTLSNGFCESLITRLPNLINLKLYNAADLPSFSFLAGNQSKLQNIKLFTPKENDNEPTSKKLIIEIN